MNEDRQRLLRRLQVAGVTVGVISIPVIFSVWLQTYFSLWGVVRTPSPAQIASYEWVAGPAVLAAVASLIIAIIRRHRGYIVTSAILLPLVFGTAFVFSVPRERWVPPQAPVVQEDRGPYRPCYSGSNDCVGG